MCAQKQSPGECLFDLFSAGITDQAICMVDERGIVSAWNAGAANFYGYAADDIVGVSANCLLGGIEVLPYLQQAFAAGSYNLESKTYKKDGSWFPAYLTFQPLYQEKLLTGYGFTAQSLAYTQKIAYRFDEAEEIKKNPGLYQRLIEHSYSGITLFDADLNFIYRSPSAARITGFNDQGRADITFNDIIHPADRNRVKTLLDDLKKTPGASITCRLRSRHYDGHFIDLEGVFTNWLHAPDIGAIVLNFRDITEHQLTENVLNQTIAELSDYKYALDAAAIVAITDQKGIIRYANKNFSTISGYTQQELIGQDHRIVNSGYHDKAFMRTLWRTISKGDIWEGDLCNRRKDGTLYWVATTIVPFLNTQGKPYQYLAIRYDRTEARYSKEELMQKNRQIGNLLESINDGFIALDRELRYTYVNRRTCEMVGMSSAAMLGRKMWDIFPDAVGSATWRAVEQALATGLPVSNEDHYPPLGLWQENHIYPNEQGLSIFINDITWRKQEEAQKDLLADVSQIFRQPLKLSALMQEVMERLISLNNDFCLVETWLLSRDSQRLVLSAQTAANKLMVGFFNDHAELRQLKAGQGLPGNAWLEGGVTFWTNLDHHPNFLRREAAAKAGLQSAFGVPLRHGGQLVGILLLGQSCVERPDLLDDKLLIRLGDHLGTEISRRQLENDLQNIFEAAPDIICIVGTDRYFKKVNPAMCAMLGYSDAELRKMSIDALVHPDDLAESQARMRRFINGELQTVYFENRYQSRSGRIIDLAWTAAKSKEEGILFCVARNISGQKELERLLNKASELARIGSWEIKSSGDPVFWSQITADILEVEPNFRPARGNAALFYTGDDLAKLNEALQSVSRGGPPFDLELELVTARQNRRWVRVLGEAEFEGECCSRVYGSIQDIDVRKRAELAANRFLSERNSILESIGDAFFSVDSNWIVQYWNHVAEQNLNTPKESIVGKNLWSVFDSAKDSPAYTYYIEAMASGEARHFEDYYTVGKRWYDVSVYPLEDGLSVFFKDITARKNTERDLEISHQRYSDLFQLSPLPKFVFDADTLAYLDVNRAAVQHYGYSREEFLKMTLRDIRPESEVARLETVVKNTDRAAYLYQAGVFTHRKKNGELIQVEITSSALNYDGRPARIALAADVTERVRHLEAIEQQNKKLREISWMQSHVIRAPLCRIMGLVGLMRNVPEGDELREIMQYIELSANELDEVIRAITQSATNLGES
ncbi:PAS domain S-box protein [Mucilaginibacter segetis]|uniref:PAS domain S-box protein n=1 Tax=Mucilaginibacter segetis TaxID=2793071 RepID=A0A934PUX1_9SPHI|nr:PAS domain S-box protein [Mucilaginibacter segetis]MBK0380011.1 PAS domain S-box protein [Mucilaginibacter segetis]